MALKFWTSYAFFYPDLERPYGEIVNEVIKVAKAAEELGYEGISFPEHHFFNYICNPSALQFATLVAQHTKRLKVLTGVLVLPYYHPLALAEEVALVDHILEGRLEVGVARGANKYEFDRLGVDWTKSREMYAESLEILKKAWTEEEFSYDGEFWSFPTVSAIPKPYSKPYPKLWVAAQSERGIRAAARAGLNMMNSPNLGSFAPHGDVDRALEMYNESAKESPTGRGEVMVLRRMFIDETEEAALKKLDACYEHWAYYTSQYVGTKGGDRFAQREDREDIVVQKGRIKPVYLEIDRDDVWGTYDDPIITSPERAVERFKHYESIGVDHVLGLTQFGIDIDEVIRSMEIVADKVMPHFQS